jgi:hypothetical protein
MCSSQSSTEKRGVMHDLVPFQNDGMDGWMMDLHLRSSLG